MMRATALAATFSGAPSTLVYAAGSGWQLGPTLRYVAEATRAAGTLASPGRPSLVRGLLVHTGVSLACGELLAWTLPERRTVLWGAGAGLALGVVNVGVIGRRYPAIATLPLAPQIADNVAFGAILGALLEP
jgi:hypothetical protein